MNIKNPKTCVILLAGGLGSRMKSSIPKQFISLKNKAIARFSFDLFCSMPEVVEIVVVCNPIFQSVFELDKNKKLSHTPQLTFALPGDRRQDSVFNGLQALSFKNIELVCIHDSARPFITAPIVRHILKAADQYGAATCGVPVKFTVKKSDAQGFVKETLQRAEIWEIQTPQIIKSSLLHAGFAIANKENITVTDDVSLVELLHHPVKLVEGEYSNLKITTPEDLILAEQLSSAHNPSTLKSEEKS